MRTLISYLNAKTPRELQTIAEQWEATVTDRLTGGNAFQLAQEMQSEFLQRRLIEKLDGPQLELVRLFARQPNYTANLQELADKQQLELLKLTGPASQLVYAGIFFEDKFKTGADDPYAIAPEEGRKAGWGQLYNWRTSGQTGTPRKIVLVMPREVARPLERLVAEWQASQQPKLPGLPLSRQPVKLLLARLEPELLEQQAEIWGIAGLLGEAKPDELVVELAGAFSDKAMQGRVLGQLPPDSVELFEKLRTQGSRTTLSALLEEYVGLKRLGRFLRPLIERRLIWEAFEGGETVIFIPSEVAQPKEDATGRHPQPLQTVAPPTDATAYPPYALAWDALTFLNYLDQHEVLLTNQGQIPKRDLKKVSVHLWKPEDLEEKNRLGFMLGLYHTLRLYENTYIDKRVRPGAALEDWLQLDFYEQTRRLIQSWLDNPPFTYPVNFPPQYNSIRLVKPINQAILGWLSECEPGTWYSLGTLLSKVQQENPYFILPRRELLQLLGSQRLAEMGKAWLIYEGEIIRQTFNTVLEWFGIVQVGRDPQGKVTTFSLTDLGAQIAGRPGASHPHLPAIEKPLLVQPNFEIMLLAPQVATLWKLLKFTTPKKLDQVSLFSLSRESVLRGLEAGFTPSELQEWLENQSAQPLAQNLIVSIKDWSKGFRRVAVENVTLLEIEDPAALDELFNAKQYAGFFVRRLSPTAALVQLPAVTPGSRIDPLKAFKDKLKAGGFYAD